MSQNLFLKKLETSKFKFTNKIIKFYFLKHKLCFKYIILIYKFFTFITTKPCFINFIKINIMSKNKFKSLVKLL